PRLEPDVAVVDDFRRVALRPVFPEHKPLRPLLAAAVAPHPRGEGRRPLEVERPVLLPVAHAHLAGKAAEALVKYPDRQPLLPNALGGGPFRRLDPVDRIDVADRCPRFVAEVVHAVDTLAVEQPLARGVLHLLPQPVSELGGVAKTSSGPVNELREPP